MKSTGIVRKVDGLGRIVLPMELRKIFDINEKDALEIYTDGDKIILQKYTPTLLTDTENALDTLQRKYFENVRVMDKLEELVLLIKKSDRDG